MHLPKDAWEANRFFTKDCTSIKAIPGMHLSCRIFLMYYRYAQKWVDLFDENHLMIRVETGHYIKGLHTLLNAHFDLRNYDKFDLVLKKFENLPKPTVCGYTITLERRLLYTSTVLK